MNRTATARRFRSRRRRRSLPVGMLVAMLTGCVVTLIGVFCRLDPFVVLVRASVSALVLGVIVSLGTNIIELANSESGDQPRDS